MIRAGRPLTFPLLDQASPRLAQAVTDRIWPCVELQWQWLGGAPGADRPVETIERPLRVTRLRRAA